MHNSDPYFGLNDLTLRANFKDDQLLDFFVRDIEPY
jgi:hypothetical protein